MTLRDRMVILVVVAVAAIVASWMFIVSPKRDQAASLGTQITAEQTQLSTVTSQVAAGETARKAFAGQYAQLAALGEAVPPDDDVPSLIFQLQSAAKAAGVDFHSLQLTGSSSSTSATPSSGSSSSTSSGSSSTAQLPPGAALGSAGLPTEQFTFALSGNFFQLADFLNRLQKFVVDRNSQLSISGRLMTVNAINLAPGSSGFPQMTATVSATTYIVPASQGPFNGATPAGPAGTTSSPQASTSGSSSPAPAAAITPVLR